MVVPPKSLDDSLSDLSAMENSRFSPCRILYEVGVPCVIWGEDALTAYDIPTIVFDLFLLVHDPESVLLTGATAPHQVRDSMIFH
jgi:hypothetical protein